MSSISEPVALIVAAVIAAAVSFGLRWLDRRSPRARARATDAWQAQAKQLEKLLAEQYEKRVSEQAAQYEARVADLKSRIEDLKKRGTPHDQR